MKYTYLFIFALIFNINGQTKDIDSLLKHAHLVFEDDFNRSEKNDSIEDLGKGWKSNSKKSAGGHKQADLRNGVLFVEMWKNANHGTSILHTAPFDDGIVTLKLKMLNSKGVKLNFNDPNAKNLAHAGHVCQISISPKVVKLIDHISGIFQKDIHKMRKNGTDKKKIQQLLKGKSSKHDVNLKLNYWYEIAILFQKDVLSVYIDKTLVKQLKSIGIDHNVKDNIALVLWGSSAEFDDLKVFSLD